MCVYGGVWLVRGVGGMLSLGGGCMLDLHNVFRYGVC